MAVGSKDNLPGKYKLEVGAAVIWRLCAHTYGARDGWDCWTWSVVSLSMHLLQMASLGFLTAWWQAFARVSIPRELGMASYALALEIPGQFYHNK